jgi:hypothetical protein
MTGSDDSFKKRPIEGIAGNHILLRNGRPAVIGYVTDKLRYTKEGGCIVPTEVCFILNCDGRKYRDYFYFENDTLVYQVVALKTEAELYLAELYSRSAITRRISPEQLITEVTEAYVMRELGFM